MKKAKAIIAVVLVASLVLSMSTVFAATTGYTDLTGGYYGFNLGESTKTQVSEDGVLTATQNADKVYKYVDTNNILQNPGFEESNTTSVVGYGGTLTTGWYAANSFGTTSGKTASIVTEPQNVHSGKNAMYIQLASGSATGGLLSNKAATPDKVSQYERTYTVTGLEAGKKYVVSYWVKGSTQTSIQFRNNLSDSGASWNKSTYYADADKQDDWELLYQEITAEAVVDTVDTVEVDRKGVLFFAIGANTNGGYTYIDDVQLVTKDQAILNIEAMIENLDITATTAAKSIYDIEQWVAKIGSSNISNYADFEAKLKAYNSLGVYSYTDVGNVLSNPGFELDSTAQNINAWNKLTTGWTASTKVASNTFSVAISDDAHSGNSALSISTIADSTAEIRLFNDVCDSTSKGLAGVTSDLTANTEYIASYWVKGTATTKFFMKTVSGDADNGFSGANAWGVDITPSETEWTLVTKSTTSSSNGDAWWNIYYVGSQNGKYALVDDVQFVPKTQAIANVEAMIKNLDVNSATAARAINDIEQWVTALGSENISNYNLFLQKKAGYVYYSEDNILLNSGFELSDTTTAINGDGYTKELTSGWTTNYGNSNVVYGIVKDAHSGNNALSITNAANTDSRTHNMANITYTTKDVNANDFDGRTINLTPNEEYIVSYWAKGDATTRVWVRSVNEDESTGYTQTSDEVVNPGDTWKLGTAKIKTNAAGQIWWCVYVATNTEASTTAIIDDVQLMTVAEAKQMVSDMLDAFAELDESDSNYARAKADLEQWQPVIDDPDLSVKYDIVFNGKNNIITPNSGYTHLAQGDYIARVTLKGNGTVNRVYGDNITNIESVATTLTSDNVTYSERVTVGVYGTQYMGVQLTETTDENDVEISSFSLKRVGDLNENGEIDIRDMVRIVRSCSDEQTVIDDMVADYDNSSAVDGGDIVAIREKILKTDKLAEVLRGKKVSVIGDSISTYKGYNNNIYSNTTTVNNSVCYYDGKPNKYDEYGNYLDWQDMKVDDTYWKQIIDITETRLLVNNAWSGSSIARQGGASRGVQLHDNYGYYEGETPDIILVHYGTNDYLSFISTGDEAYGLENFAASYDEMVAAMLAEYPGVDIYLFTFPPYKTNEEHVAIEQEYNDAIRATAEKYGCPLVDLFNDSEFTLDTFKSLTVDGLHPNKAGMDVITDTLYNVMYEQYIG